MGIGYRETHKLVLYPLENIYNPKEEGGRGFAVTAPMAGTSFATKKACLNTCELRSLGITVTLFRPVGQFIPLHGILVMYRAS